MRHIERAKVCDAREPAYCGCLLNLPCTPVCSTMPSEDDIKECLELFDKDNKEVIDAKELGSVLRMMGAFPSEEDLTAAVRAARLIPRASAAACSAV